MKLKILPPILIFLYCLYYISSIESWHFIDNVNLIIHEAGHVVFMPFGYLIYVAGGTIFQILIPIVFIGYFFLQQKGYSASLLLFWLAVNLFNISLYSGDALTQKLPLITGDAADHDWNQMLAMLGWLRHTALISHTFLFAGIIVALIALAWGIYSSRNEQKFDTIIAE